MSIITIIYLAIALLVFVSTLYNLIFNHTFQFVYQIFWSQNCKVKNTIIWHYLFIPQIHTLSIIQTISRKNWKRKVTEILLFH